jgi:aspartate aminotransferase
MGFVNAPSLIQLAIGRCLEEKADLDFYARNGADLYNGLTEMGYECVEPQGAFYLWVKAPCSEQELVQALKEEHILATAGSAFAGPGYVRLSYCVAHETIMNAMPGFRRVMERIG